jgi:outer membrane protein OmpA-like peptidoglycan-associated protein
MRQGHLCAAMIGMLGVLLPRETHAQTAPVNAISTEALVDALTPAPRPLTRGLSPVPREAPVPSIDLAVGFEFGSSNITSEARQLLSSLGDALQSPSLASLRFRLSGHTDAVGSDTVNDRLSLARAEAVRSHLIEVHGVAPDRLDVVGHGRRRLLFPDAPDDHRNRRVEVSVMED